MGATKIPPHVPKERLRFLSQRAAPGDMPGKEPRTEWYFTDTGESVESENPKPETRNQKPPLAA
jgi:hypothetical protein